MSKNSPCMGCPERFTACSDRCPKDERGEYGYKAWKAELEAIKEAARRDRNLDWTYAKRTAKWRSYRRDNSGAYKKFSS